MIDDEINTNEDGDGDGSPSRPKDSFIENLHIEI